MRHILSLFILIIITLTLLSSSDGHTAVWEYDDFGAAVKHTVTNRKTVHLIFTADSAFEGGVLTLDLLKDRGVKASFFFTGNFMRDSMANGDIIRRAIMEGHYVGPHGDRHILLADWNKERTTLASTDSALTDIENAYPLLEKYGVSRDSAIIFIPSFEWYNKDHIDTFRKAGLFPVNMTPGIETYRDYTTPDLPYYTSSEWIWNQLMEHESSNGLDGAIILIHLGTDSTRTDKFYRYLPELIDTLSARSYIFERFRVDK